MTKLFSSFIVAKTRLASGAKSFLRNNKGVTAIEYGLIAALVGVAIIGGAQALGGKLNSTFNSVATTLGNATTSTSTTTPAE